MSGYRLYFMSRFGEHIEKRHDFVADGDAAAIRNAERCRNGQPMELWQRDRKIKRWRATSRPSPIGTGPNGALHGAVPL